MSSSLSLPLSVNEIGKARPLNVMRDLSKVADLVELCFQQNMDKEGQSYVEQMRTASRDKRFLNWASTSMPLIGYIWEYQKDLIGNISIIPFRKRTYLLANIAVHPEYRRKGIARHLTQMGLNYARQHNAESVWLHVEEDNHAAIHLYESLGFQARTRRTTWNTSANFDLPQAVRQTSIHARPARLWQTQYAWLQRAYPEELTWYRMPDWQIFSPGIKHWLYRIFVESDIRQWSVERDGRFQAALTWMQTRTRRAPLWLATTPQADTQSLTNLLLHARFHLSAQHKDLYLDYPAGENDAAFILAGFTPRRTLLWMRAAGS